MRNIKKRIPQEIKNVPINPDLDYNHSEDGEIDKDKELKLQQHIGKLLMSFSFLEKNLDEALYLLITNGKFNNSGIIIIRSLFFKQKLTLYSDLITDHVVTCVGSKKKRVELLKEIKVLINKAEELSEFRNSIAHADWTGFDMDYYFTTKIVINNTKENAYLCHRKIEITPLVINKFIRQNKSLGDKFDMLVEKVYTMVGSN